MNFFLNSEPSVSISYYVVICQIVFKMANIFGVSTFKTTNLVNLKKKNMDFLIGRYSSYNNSLVLVPIHL